MLCSTACAKHVKLGSLGACSLKENFENIYVTRFVKGGLPHTSNLPALVIRNFRLGNVSTLKSSQYWNQHSLIDGENFRLVSFLNTKLWSSKFIELDVCVEDPFCKSGHIYGMWRLFLIVTANA